jgi:hypothetical protein
VSFPPTTAGNLDAQGEGDQREQDQTRRQHLPLVHVLAGRDIADAFDKALEAFEGNRFLLLVNDCQAESLDDEIVIEPGTCVSFLKLTPLVGG